jgi:hypothetical protein
VARIHKKTCSRSPFYLSYYIRSPLGEHIIFVQEREASRRATLEEVRSLVSSDIRNDVADQVLVARVKELREKYDLEIEGSES